MTWLITNEVIYREKQSVILNYKIMPMKVCEHANQLIRRFKIKILLLHMKDHNPKHLDS